MGDRLTPETARRLRTLVDLALMAQGRYDRATYRERATEQEYRDAERDFKESLSTLYLALDALIDREGL